MPNYIRLKDIEKINQALAKGLDVRIQKKKDGIKITSEKITVLTSPKDDDDEK